MATQMVRKQIYIQKRQDILIKQLAQAHGVSEAEVIRQAIERELSGSRQPISGSTTALDDFSKLALSKRTSGANIKPYRWDREEIYKEREGRWLREGDAE